MKLTPATGLSLACLVFGIGFYLVGVAGLLWPKTSPADVGLLSTCVVFVLFGVLGLLLAREQTKPQA